MVPDPVFFMVFCSFIIMKWRCFFKQRNGTCERLEYFQIFLGFWIIYALSIIMIFKMITTIFILMCWNSKRKIQILVKSPNMKYKIRHIGVLKNRSSSFLYQSHALFWKQYIIKIIHGLIDSDNPHITRTLTDLVNMETHVNFLLMWIKKHGIECNRNISLLKKIFYKHFRVFHKFADAANEQYFVFKLEFLSWISLEDSEF